MATEDDGDKAAADRYRLVSLALTAAALGLAVAALVLGILREGDEGASPLLTIAVVVLALNGLRAVERDGR